ncbi:MAG: response regulator [Planctomycetes bacterium]|nr:response regulator [Planctomycetota bacterium]
MSTTEGRTHAEGLAEQALLAHVRHEIRSPINAILGYGEILQEDAEASGQTATVADLQIICAAGKELLGLVDDLLSPARAAGRGRLDWDALGVQMRHAMRTPINTILGYCEMLAEEDTAPPSETFIRDLAEVATATRQLLALIEDILRLANPERAALTAGPALPGASAAMQEAVKGLVSAIRLPPGAAAAPRPTGALLLADDNPVDRELLVRRLKREGHTVATAVDGMQALEAIRKSRPELVLLDVLMPELNGFQVLDQLKADPALRSIPVIMLSSWDEAESVARCLEVGAEDYLPKPVNSTVLLARIAGCLERKRERDREVSQLRQVEEEKAARYGECLGKHPAIARIRQSLEKLAGAREPVLIVGEAGTGKELVGRTLHARGRGKEAPLLSVDGRQIADSPWGDKLLGDARAGESTLMPEGTVTYLDLVDGGTLLLKRIESLPLRVQTRLARFLEGGDPLPGRRRPDVRLIATCGAPVADLERTGQLLPALAALLSRHVLELPPLRERKRDIPELAGYFVRRHAGRLNKQVEKLEDAAVTRLVTHDYAMANVEELERTVERAVVLAGRDSIDAEEIFLGVPAPRPSPGFNLLRLPEPVLRLGLRLFPDVVAGGVAVFFLFLVATCFFPVTIYGEDLGTRLVWSVWWPGLMLLFLTVGRVWCAICPMSFAGGLAQRLFRPRKERRIPAWIKEHDTAIATAGFFLIVWVEEATRMRHSPLATGFLLLAILSGAVLAGVLFPRRTWCRHLCPLGGFGGICSTTSVLELRPTPDVCTAKCKGHACYTGTDGSGDGCPMFQHVMFVNSNRACVLCLKCVKNCPNGSPQLNLRAPARELWSGQEARPAVGASLLVMLGLLAAQSLLSAWESGGPGGMAALLAEHRVLVVSALLGLGAALPLAFAVAVERRLGASGDAAKSAAFWRRIIAGTPLLATGYAAYQFGFLPALGNVMVTLGWQAGAAPAATSWTTFSLLRASQAGLLAAGLAIALVALVRLRSAVAPGAGAGVKTVGGAPPPPPPARAGEVKP